MPESQGESSTQKLASGGITVYISAMTGLLRWPYVCLLLLAGGSYAMGAPLLEGAQDTAPTRDQLDLIAQTNLYPVEVTLKEAVTFTQVSSQGSAAKFRLPPGNRVKLVSVSPGQATLEAVGTQADVPIAATDFFERMEQRRDETHTRRLREAQQARDDVPQPHVQANLEQILTEEMTRDRIELALDAYPWPQDRVATSHLAREVMTFLAMDKISLVEDKEKHLLVTGQTTSGTVLELHWSSSLPRNQFFVRAPTTADRHLSKGFSYEIPSEKPILHLLPGDKRSMAEPPKPKPGPATASLRTMREDNSPPAPFPAEERDDVLARFDEGELNRSETRRLLAGFEITGNAVSREELEDLVAWLQPKKKSYREEASGLTATLYLEKPYLFITMRREANAYEFVVYPQGFWQSEPIRFMFNRDWFQQPAPPGSPQEPEINLTPSAPYVP